MSLHPSQGRLFLAVVTFLALVASAHAIIQAALPLDALLAVSQFIVVAKVEKIDTARPQVVVMVDEDLKGKASFRRLAIDFKGDDEAKKLDHLPQLLKRLAPDLPLILFIDHRARTYTVFAYTNGTWFQVLGQQAGDGDRIGWRLTHGEPYLRGTFKGATAELRRLLIDAAAGRGKLPKENKKEEPGFGPEVGANEKKTGGLGRDASPLASFVRPAVSAGSGGPLFGVIPTLGVGAPLVVLAALFPAVFGGVLILFRQWIAFITVFSLNSSLLLVHWVFQSYWPRVLLGSWFGSEAGLWFLMTLVTLAGAVWAWRRQSFQQSLGDGAVGAPRRTELTVLWLLAGLLVLVSVITPLLSWHFTDRYDPRADLAWMLILVLTLGVLAGAIYRTRREHSAHPLLAAEGVMLLAILAGHVGYSAYRWGGGDLGTSGEPIVSGPASQPAAGLHAPRFQAIRWQFSPKNLSGLIVAAPFVHGNDVYVAAAGPTFKQGTLFCVDRHTGAQKWDFLGESGDLKQMISGPVVYDGKLYMGEGFHDDPNCRLFCVNAADGTLLWAFKTTGQTECSPCVSGDKVYFGAGNDGIYCVNTADGKEVWRFPPQPRTGRLLRCGATPAVADNRLYAGSAVDRNQKEDPGETSIFCLAADSGKPHWRRSVPLPAWAAPVLTDQHAFYALGNGDVFSDADKEKPAGMILCVDRMTGGEIWQYDAPNGVLDRPAVDEQHIYFGCRDGYVYCVGHHDGKFRWKASLGSPVIASPVLARCPGYGQTAHVFAVSTAGKVVCLEPATGASHWSLDLTDREAGFYASPRVVVTRSESGDHRLLYVAGGVGGLYTGRPVLYCIEDFVKVE
jgi:outer membrane protein assembly factor BamB